MAIFKANFVKRGKDATARAKASVRYIQHRPGNEGERITRQLFNQDGPLTRPEAYQMIDEAPQKGTYFYRFVISPDPKREDHHHDLDMRDISLQTMQALEELTGASIQWVGATHADHAPHLHAHLIAVVPKRLSVKDFQALRARATAACLAQRRFLTWVRDHRRERPYPSPTSLRRERSGVPGLFYPPFGASPYAKRRKRARGRLAKSLRHAPVYRQPPKLVLCTCPRCRSLHLHTALAPLHHCSCGFVLHRPSPRGIFRSERRKGAGWAL